DSHITILTPRGEPLAAIREDDTRDGSEMSAQAVNDLTSSCLPDEELVGCVGMVVGWRSPRCDQLAIRTERQSKNTPGVASKALHLVARRRLPDIHGAGRAGPSAMRPGARGQELAVGTESHAPDVFVGMID